MSAHILVIEDDTTLRGALQRFLTRCGYTVRAAADGEAGLALAREQPADVVLVDLNLPGMNGLAVIGELREGSSDAVPVIMTAYPEVRTAVAALKAGAYDYINKPFDLEDLAGLVERAVEVRQLRHEVAWRRVQSDVLQDEPMVGRSRAFQEVHALAARLAQAPGAPVLVLGESGAGKEHLARALHRLSARRHGPWITLDCAASGSEHFDQVLFGSEAQGGNAGQRGLLELAGGGTLLLDEIGDLAPALQAKLLRVIELQVFRRAGSVRDQPANVRFIAATHRDLAQEVAAGRFRQDLLFRLDVGRLEVPPLRARHEDVMPLAQHFLELFARRMRRPVPAVDPALVRRLEAYAWPGNVRELRNVMERLLILSNGSDLTTDKLPREFAAAAPAPMPARNEAALTLAEVELRHIQRVLAHCDGNKTRAAEVLGISRLTLRQRLKDAGLADDTR
jgi:two-component system, NtrC family, response regulator AtoC